MRWWIKLLSKCDNVTWAASRSPSLITAVALVCYATTKKKETKLKNYDQLMQKQNKKKTNVTVSVLESIELGARLLIARAQSDAEHCPSAS